jgi:biotin synthase
MEYLKEPLKKLVFRADKIRKKHTGDRLELCSIINAKSGLCGEDCKFCAQSARHASKISRYSLKSKDEIVKAARRAKEIGAQKFGIVTSGNKLTPKELNIIAQAISEIKNKIGIIVCASLGALKKDQLKTLKKAGLSRYHHNIETSPRFYPRVCSTHNIDERIRTIKHAKDAGLEVCSGGIIGMGETWQDRIDMARLLKKLGVDSVPINLLVPIKGTSLENTKPISFKDAVRTVSIFRIILKDKVIKIAAGREAVLKDSQVNGFTAGANGMLIGGYLTVKGIGLEEDYKLIKEIKRLWKK